MHRKPAGASRGPGLLIFAADASDHCHALFFGSGLDGVDLCLKLAHPWVFGGVHRRHFGEAAAQIGKGGLILPERGVSQNVGDGVGGLQNRVETGLLVNAVSRRP